MSPLLGVAALAIALAPVAETGSFPPDAGPAADDVSADAGVAPDAGLEPPGAGVESAAGVESDAGVEPQPAPAPPPTVEAGAEQPLSEDERRALEQSVAADAIPDLSKVNLGAALPEALQSFNPDMAVILDVAGAWFSVDEPLQTGAHDPRTTGFTLQQLEMTLSASVDPFLRFDSALVFSPEEGVELEEAYATTLALPLGLQMRAGQFLHRFGRVNPTHPHAWRFVDQPIALGKLFGDEGSRAAGGEVSWLVPVPWFTELVVELTNANGLKSFNGDEAVPMKSPLDLLVTGALQQFFALSEDLSLLVGVSAQAGPNATGNGNRTEIYGGDLVLRYRPVQTGDAGRWSLSLETEALFRSRQVPFGSLQDGGGYTQLIWQIDPQWETGARYELVSGLANDTLDPEWTDWRQRATAQVTWFPSHFSRLRFQGSVDHPAWQQGLPVFAVMAQLEVLVGAHGAHSY